MTLEDFFTLPGVKDGLASHSRVEELIYVMQKDTETAVQDVTETARQWSSVASTLAATVNRDSLDHFVRLDGLLFLDRWLQKAEKLSNDRCDNSVEESISLLLGALKKLSIDKRRSVSSGIGATVEKLFSHKSVTVQERARALFDGWNEDRDNDKDQQDIVKVGEFLDDRLKQADTVIERNADGKPIASEHQHSRSSDGFQSKDNIDHLNNSVSSNTTLNRDNKEDGFRENAQGSSFMSNSCQGSISIREETSRSPAERMSSTRVRSIPAAVEWRSSDIPKLKDGTDDTKEVDVRNDCPDEIGKKEPSSVSASSGPESVSSADPASVMQADVVNNINTKETEVSTEDALPAGLGDDRCTLVTELKNLGVESGTVERFKSAVEVEGKDLEASYSGKQDAETADNVEEGMGKGYETNVAMSKPETHTEVDMEFDYGLDDALEVARQVAIEVEREVVDYREQLCSSSSDDDVVQQPRSPDDGDMCMVQSDADKTEDCMQKIEAAETFQGSKKGMCDIDLNEVCSEEVEHPTITFVCASKVTPAGVPRAPLHFEGELGWKGSAATSAFRPACVVRRSHDGEDSSQSSKQRQGHLDFDLNVAEDYGGTHPELEKQMPVSSDLESCIEVSSRKAQQRLKLDLNRVGDNEETPWSEGLLRYQQHHRNGSPSPASSSSSRQFCMRNIDLNGNPSLFDDSSDQPQRPAGFSKCDLNSSWGCNKMDGPPVVSILGARVAINRPELVMSPQTRSFLPNTRSENNGMGSSRHQLHPLGNYTSQSSSSLYGYNGFSIGPPAAYYGGGPAGMVMPPIPSSDDVPPPSQVLSTPFLMSMSGPFIRPSFDLNSAGLTVVEGENREGGGGGLRQLFFPGQGLFMEEQQMMRSASQPIMGPAGVGAKRKEPDGGGGWDMFPPTIGGYKPWRR